MPECSLADWELDRWVHERIMGQPSGAGVRSRHFTRDLNACAEAEAKIAELGRSAIEAYVEALHEIYVDGPDAPNIYRDGGWHGFANARQRCEAMYAIREAVAERTLIDQPEEKLDES